MDSWGRRPSTIKNYLAAVADFERVAGITQEADVTPDALDGYLGRLSMAGKSEATRRARADGVRAYFRFCAKRRLIPSDPTEQFRGPRDKRGSVPELTRKEIMRLIWDCPRPELARGKREPDALFERRRRVAEFTFERDTAVLALTYSLGLRASEVGGLRVTDVIRDAQGRASVAVMGKWAKAPTVMSIDRRVQDVVERFLVMHGSAGALFPPVGARGAREARAREGIGRRGIGLGQVAALLASRVRLAGIKAAGRRISPHILRYSVANHLYANGRGLDIYGVSAFLRHKDIKTTERYLRAWAQQSITARAATFLPWNPRGRAASQHAPLV